MNKTNKKQGMTLIEIVVSLGLLGILTVLFLGLFLSSLKMIERSGEREKIKVAASSSMDNFLINNGYADADITVTAGSVIINYPDGSTTVSGKEVKIDKYNSDGSQVEIKGFIP